MTMTTDPTGPVANAYELACDRMEAARRNCQHASREAERILREADDEWRAADLALAALETRAGIPLPGYRQEATSC
jgi:hypothetical protein